jgi:hypothetical protein
MRRIECMFEILEHPEIGHIQRTGYPSWMQEDNEPMERDEDALYEERREAEYGW